MRWHELLSWSKNLDFRDIPDEANRYADYEVDVVNEGVVPIDVGAWKASLALAFAAGQKWEQRGESQ